MKRQIEIPKPHYPICLEKGKTSIQGLIAHIPRNKCVISKPDWVQTYLSDIKDMKIIDVQFTFTG